MSMVTKKVPSIADVARQVAMLHPSILDGMRMRILNYSSLTERLLPEIQRLTGKKKINPNAVKIALIRFSEQLTKDWKIQEELSTKVLKNTIVELRNDLFVITIKKSSIGKLNHILQKVDDFRFFQLVKGTDSFTIAVDYQHKEFLTNMFDKRQVLSALTNQSALVLISPPSIIHQPGVIAYTTNLLSYYNINVTQMFSCHTDTVFIINREDAIPAFEVFENQIQGIRS